MRLRSGFLFSPCLLLVAFCAFQPPQASFKEDFEADSKGTYDAAIVTLASGPWRLQDALLGSTEADHKSGEKAVRLRKKGKVTMNFDLPGGVSTVAIRYARYGDDEASDWELWYSTTQGKSWQVAGPKVTASTVSLKKASFSLNVKGPVRLEVRKVSGDDARLNLDDWTFDPFGAPATKSEAPAKAVTSPVVVAKKPAPGEAPNPYLLLGNPSGATADVNNPDNYLMIKPQFALSYNRTKGIPNWVSWYIDQRWLGKAERQNDFRPDKDLPAGWPRITPADYTGGGFDRGHVCPSADRQNTVESNSATFLMTNMVPQAPDNNQGPWEKLEDYCRRLVEKDIELYVIAGSYGTGGTGSNGFRRDLKGKVAVPAHTWKVVVVLPQGENDLGRITTTTRVIAIDIPNTQGIKENYWTAYVTSVDAIEKATGYDLLANLPKAVQDVLEAKVNR